MISASSLTILEQMMTKLSLIPVLGGLVLSLGCRPPASATQSGNEAKQPRPNAPPKEANSIAKRSDATPMPIPTPYDKASVGVRLPGKDICATNPDGSLKNPIEAGSYSGLLRNAICEQQKFITMARIAKSLDVQCNFCHVPRKDKPNAEDYPVHTRRKDVANWMSSTFIQGLKKSDGKKIMCEDCHANKKNFSRAKILGTPRESDFAQEWMSEVMTTAFRHRSGKRLKCKTCHLGMAPSRNGWDNSVILRLQVQDANVLRAPQQQAAFHDDTQAPILHAQRR